MKLNTWLKGCIIGFGFVITQLTFSLYMPALPTLEHFFGIGHQQILASVTKLLIGYGAGQLVWGTVSDQFGRQKIVITALLLYMVSTVGAALSTHFLMFSIMLALMGFFSSALTSVGNAMLRDVYGQSRVPTIIARIGIAMAAGPVIAPAIGSHLLYWFNWQFMFFALIGVAAIMLGGMFFLGETNRNQDKSLLSKGNVVSVYKMLLSNPHYVGYILCLGLVFGCLIGYVSVAPFIFTHFYSLSIREYGSMFLLASASYIATSIVYSRMAHRVHPSRFVGIGVLVTLLGCVLLCVVADLHLSLWLLIAASSIMMCGLGCVLPASKAGAMTVFDHHNGAAASIMKTVQIYTGVLVTEIASHLYSAHSFLGVTVLYVVVSVTAVVIFAVTFQLNPLRRAKAHSVS